MKRKYKVGDQVIITRVRGLLQHLSEHIEAGKVGTVRTYGEWTGNVFVEPFGIAFSEDDLELVKSYPEVENLILERDYEKEAFNLKMFVVGIFAFVLFLLGMWFIFEDSKSMPLVNYLTGIVSIAGATFMLWIIKETKEEKRAVNKGFNQEIIEARTEDLMN